MRRVLTLLLAAGLVFSATTSAQAIDFKAKGQWLMGFSAGEGNLVKSTRQAGDAKRQADSNDTFTAAQRVRLQLQAIANENLSGTVYFEIGDSAWGKPGGSGALGADDTCIEVKNAYIDWAVPETDLKVRMGIQGIAMPNYAGGSAILDDDVAGVVASYQFNENVGLNLMWARPYNDNYTQQTKNGYGNDKDNYLDNVDLISLQLPLNFDGIETTPWIMYGIIGQNAFRTAGTNDFRTADYSNGRYVYMQGYNSNDRWDTDGSFKREDAYTSAFWAGLPVKVSMFDPFNIEFDFNYGYMESQGEGLIAKNDASIHKFDTRREGFLVKALVEYKMDWGTPGLFAWYASGDDDDPSNGSERMPSISPCGNFTSFMGDGNWGWSSDGSLYDRNLAYAGTWGVGLQIKDMSFLENLTHTFRVAYWGGTNSESMVKYAKDPTAWGSWVEYGTDDTDLYLTTADSILEFNLVNSYQMYENFEINLELGYLVNFIDNDTWKKADRSMTFEKQDAWKAQVIFAYSF